MSKFKNTEELEKAYKELEREFTKKSQKLAEVEKTNYVTLLHNEMDNLLNDYAKRRISDLEAKLAESEERVKDLEFRNKNLEHSLKVAPNANAGQRARIVELKEINHKLKQQLAEKEKEIEINKNALKKLIKNCDTVKCENKSSFAIEQLEEVKKLVEEKGAISSPFGNLKIQASDVSEIIDNQIKAIKGDEVV